MNIFKTGLLTTLLSTCLFVSTASASPINYSFDTNAVSSNLFNNGHLAYYFLNSSYRAGTGYAKANVTFTPTNGNLGNVLVTFTDKLTQYGVNANGTVNYNNVLATNIDYTVSFSITNALKITSPEGIIGYGGVGATSSGHFSIAQGADVTGDGIADSIDYDFQTKFMNFASYANSPNDYRSEISGVGNSNFFLWDSVLLGGIAAKSWNASVGAIYINGIASTQITSAGGDVHLLNGTTVPEPSSMLLLGSSLLIRLRRKRS